MHMTTAFIDHASVEKFTERHYNKIRLPIRKTLGKNLIPQ